MKRGRPEQKPVVKKKEERISTNNTLKFKQGQENTIFYLPVYARMIVKSISKLSYSQMTANLNVQILISIRYEGISDYVKKQMIHRGIRLSFDKDENILLKDENTNVSLEDEPENKILHFTVRKFIGTSLQCYIRLSPFEKIIAVMSITFNKVKIPACQTNPEATQIHFNLMDYEHEKIKISSSTDSNFGLFEVVQSELSAVYNETLLHTNATTTASSDANDEKARLKQNKRAKKAKKGKASGKQKPQAFNAANFRVPLFKKPVVGILTIFLPLLLLSIINLGIFFEEPDLHKRIVSIAAVMVSIVALVPVIRDQIPPTPTITVVQILVFAQALTTIFALLQSLIIETTQNPETFKFVWQQSVFFLLSMIVTIIVNAVVGVIALLHQCIWVPYYRNEGKEDRQKNDIYDKINTINWMNPECDKKFMNYFKMKIIQVVKDKEYRQRVMVNSIIQSVKIQQKKQPVLNFLMHKPSMKIEEENEDEMDSEMQIQKEDLFEFINQEQ